jgi:hypothetical protein
VAERDTVGIAARGLASFPMERGRGTERTKQVTDAARGGLLAVGSTLEARADETGSGT